ncbi:MAG TPA: DNA double-strand break repair nuclease NurA [Candidatus Bathyarchaeia archaeon]|nr:DNA double-strand break repair nuclease NurA [Candidatus Bathyarchaeia archaeon]
MQALRGSTLNPRSVSLAELGIDDGDYEEQLAIPASAAAIGLERVPILPVRDASQIVACDASSVKIGETDNGMIFAIRAVAAWRYPKKIMFTRWGPLLFHVPNSDDDTSKWAVDESRIFGGLSVKTLRILTRLRNHVERWVQEVLSTTVKNGILLIDGSLTAGTPDNPAGRVNKILTTARNNNSLVVAISKSTQLTVGGKNILAFSNDANTPHLIDITHIVDEEYPAYPVRFLGHVFVTKLSADGFLFRVDVDREVSAEDATRALGRVAGADVVFHGYPETLRIAHIFSTFTSNEILAIQRFVAANHRVTLQARPNLRRSLFGPFGTNRYVA